MTYADGIQLTRLRVIPCLAGRRHCKRTPCEYRAKEEETVALQTVVNSLHLFVADRDVCE